MTAPNLVLVAGETVRRLKAAAETSGGAEALHEAGHAGGAALYAAFAEQVRSEGGADPSEMPLEDFSAKASSFFSEAGWGRLTLRSSHDALAVVDIDGCWEASSAGGCNITTGVLAGFLGPLADYQVAVMEIECSSEGSATCRFLAGNAEVMDDAYERMRAGEGWERIGAAEG